MKFQDESLKNQKKEDKYHAWDSKMMNSETVLATGKA